LKKKQTKPLFGDFKGIVIIFVEILKTMLLLNIDPQLFTKEISTTEAMETIRALYEKAYSSNCLTAEDIIISTRSMDLIKNKLIMHGEISNIFVDQSKKEILETQTNTNIDSARKKFLVQLPNGEIMSMLKYYVNNHNYKNKTEKNSHAVCSELIKMGYIKREEPQRILLIPPVK